MKTLRLITCDEAFQARLIQGALENEGIASVLHNENTSNVLRGYGTTIAGVDVLVYEDDYERAMALLERNGMIPEQLRYCPHCHSPHIRFVLKKGRRLKAIVASVLSALTMTAPAGTYGEYVCDDCGARFDRPAGKEKTDNTTKE